MHNITKRILLVAVAVMMLLPFLCFNVSAADPVIEKIGTIDIPRDNCITDDKKVMIPFRLFWETFGATVDWNDEQAIAKELTVNKMTIYFGRIV